MATGNVRPRATSLPPFSGGVIEVVDDANLIKAGTLGEGETLVPERTPELATGGGSRNLLKLHDDGAAAELSPVVAPGAKVPRGATVIGWSWTTTKHHAHAVTSDLAGVTGAPRYTVSSRLEYVDP